MVMKRYGRKKIFRGLNVRPEPGAAVHSAEEYDVFFYIFRVGFAAVFCIFMLVLVR